MLETIMYVLMVFICSWFVKDIITVVYLKRHPIEIEQPITTIRLDEQFLKALQSVTCVADIEAIRKNAWVKIDVNRIVKNVAKEQKDTLDRIRKKGAYLGFFVHPQLSRLMSAYLSAEETIRTCNMNIFIIEWVLRMTDVDVSDPYKAFGKVTHDLLGNLIVLKGIVKDMSITIEKQR